MKRIGNKTGYSSHLFKVDKTEEMIGSYGPATDAYEKKFQLEEAPSGLLARGHYDAKVKYRLFNLSIPFLLMRLCRANLLTMTVLSTLNGTGLLISRRIGRSDHNPPKVTLLSFFLSLFLPLFSYYPSIKHTQNNNGNPFFPRSCNTRSRCINTI